MRVLVFALFFLICNLFLVPYTEAKDYVSSRSFRNVKVEVKLLDTPLINVNNYPNSLRSGSGKWLALEISYYPPKSYIKSNKFVWVDDVKLEAQVLMPAYYNGRDVMALMTGSVVYWSIPMDGKKHYAMLLVPPQIIKRYSRPNIKMRKDSVLARVALVTKNKDTLFVAYARSSVSSSRANQLFARYNQPISNALRLDNAVLPRSKTPWAFIRYDYYDLIKEKQEK
jgi:hypothetical protein